MKVRMETIEIREGRSNATCKSCGMNFDSKERRVVIHSASPHFPEHYHLSCFVRDNGDALEELIIEKEGRGE